MAITTSVLPQRQGSILEVPKRGECNVAQFEPLRAGRQPGRFTAEAAQPHRLEALESQFDEISIRFEADLGALWCSFNHTERPCFTPRLLEQIQDLQGVLRRGLAAPGTTAGPALRSLVWSSRLPTLWNLGGDLQLFVRLIRDGVEHDLRSYAYACVSTVFQNFTKMDLPILTVALIQGDALGGGFEAALTNDVIIAEEDAKFGLPEVLFNMFPGMGAYSLLCRRLDGSRARQMITSGRLYEAEELLQMGLVDLVVPSGEGPGAVRDYLARNRRRHNVLRALSDVYRRCQPVTREELIEVTEIWVETALKLDETDLRRMERLATAQTRRWARAVESEGIEADAPLSAVG